MSKLYQRYLELKAHSNCEPNTLFLFKSGLFFLFLDEDAKLASSLLDLKLCPLNRTIMKCGFPATSLQKYLNLLKNTPYQVRFVALDDGKPRDFDAYLYHEQVQGILHEIMQVDIDHLSISEIYDFLSHIQQELSLARKDFDEKGMLIEQNKKQ